MRPRSATIGLVFGLIAVVLFGISTPATRVAVAYLDPWFVTFARAATGGLLAAAALLVARVPFPRAHIGRLTASALCVAIGAPAFMALGLQNVPSVHGGVIMGLLPLATAIAAVVFAHERPSPAFWGLAVLGAVLVAAFTLRDSDLSVVIGDIFLVICVLLYGAGYAISAMVSREIPGWTVIAWGLVIVLPVMLVATALTWPGAAATIPNTAWLGVAYVGVMSQFVAFGFWNVALAAGGVARVGQLQLMQPFVTIAFGALVLGEHLDVTTILFAIAIGIVVALGRRTAIGSRAPVSAAD